MKRTLTIQDKKKIILLCNDRCVKKLYTESHFEDLIEISEIRVSYYSGGDQGLLYDIYKEECAEFIEKIYTIKNNSILEKYRELLT